MAAVRGSGPCGLCLSEGWRLGLVLIELLLNYWPVAGDYGLLSGKTCISGGMRCCVRGLRTCGLDGLGLGTAVCSLEGFDQEGLDRLGPGLRRRTVGCRVASEMYSTFDDYAGRAVVSRRHSSVSSSPWM